MTGVLSGTILADQRALTPVMAQLGSAYSSVEQMWANLIF